MAPYLRGEVQQVGRLRRDGRSEPVAGTVRGAGEHDPSRVVERTYPRFAVGAVRVAEDAARGGVLDQGRGVTAQAFVGLGEVGGGDPGEPVRRDGRVDVPLRGRVA